MTSSFTGHIAGLGTSSGVRIMVGVWDDSPFGPFADVMIEDASGHRTLLASRQAVADSVASAYAFDEIRIEPVSVERGQEWSVHTRSLQLRFTPGQRLWVAPLLGLVPSPMRRSATWAKVCNPVAGRVMPGVRTYRSAGNGRTEWYAAKDIRRLVDARATWEGEELGELGPVEPAVHFGFASAPVRPTLTSLTSYVRR
jgi:hypothetical protein